MSQFEKFQFDSLAVLEEKIQALGLDLKTSADLSPLSRPLKIGAHTCPNAVAILPMEGCDGLPDGSPSELTRRRYLRFFSGGAGLVWAEACAVVREGKANPLQLHLHRENVDQFAHMVRQSKQAALDATGKVPLCILQLTHSGRYSRPDEPAAPIIGQHDPLLDLRVGVGPGDPVVTDDYLDQLQGHFVRSALLAREAGFDGVDIKACHRYLVSELLAGHTRTGKYGGSFENRSRFLLETVRAVRAAVGADFIVACRFNVFDAHPYPYGFGVSRDDCWVPDLTEPLALVRELMAAGIDLLSNSSGNPYYRFPQVTRPLDTPTIGGEVPDEHPLESVARLVEFTRQIQATAGDVPVVGNGYSWLRQYLPQVAAANLADDSMSLVGLGREAFAYPDAPLDIFRHGEMNPKKCCIACSKCTQIMRDHGKTGCVIRDGEVYSPLYKEAREAAVARENQ